MQPQDYSGGHFFHPEAAEQNKMMRAQMAGSPPSPPQQIGRLLEIITWLELSLDKHNADLDELYGRLESAGLLFSTTGESSPKEPQRPTGHSFPLGDRLLLSVNIVEGLREKVAFILDRLPV